MARAGMWLALLLPCGAVPGPAQAEGWLQADAPREWTFPRDHGAHPGYRTEWWYFTGNLTDDRSGVYGYQLTIFRVGVRRRLDPAEVASSWSVRDLYLGHLAVSDGAGGGFHYADRLSRSGPGLAGASTAGLDVWVLDWRAQGRGEAIHLTGGTEEFALDLLLRADKPVVLHGEGGRSRKGPCRGSPPTMRP